MGRPASAATVAAALAFCALVAEGMAGSRTGCFFTVEDGGSPNAVAVSPSGCEEQACSVKGGGGPAPQHRGRHPPVQARHRRMRALVKSSSFCCVPPVPFKLPPPANLGSASAGCAVRGGNHVLPPVVPSVFPLVLPSDRGSPTGMALKRPRPELGTAPEAHCSRLPSEK